MLTLLPHGNSVLGNCLYYAGVSLTKESQTDCLKGVIYSSSKDRLYPH